MLYEEQSQNGQVLTTSTTNKEGVLQLAAAGIRDLDPRLKILIVLTCSGLQFLTNQSVTALFSMLILWGMLFASGQGRGGVPYLLAYGVLAGCAALSNLPGAGILRSLLGVMLYVMSKIVPVFMAGFWLVGTTKISTFLAAMQAIRLPGVILLPLTVLLRFIPTLKEELVYIREAMRMRNIPLHPLYCIRHPIQSMECFLIPLLMRSLKVADELSVAALTRGLDGRSRRTSFEQVRITMPETVFTLLIFLLLVWMWYMDKRSWVL